MFFMLPTRSDWSPCQFLTFRGHNDVISEQLIVTSEYKRLLLQRRQSLPVLEEEDPDWIRVGRLSDFKVPQYLPYCYSSHISLTHSKLPLNAPLRLLFQLVYVRPTPANQQCHLSPIVCNWHSPILPTLNLLGVQNGKQTRAVILPDNSAIVLYRTSDDEVYCSDANSTAYKFPMIDANVIESEFLPPCQEPTFAEACRGLHSSVALACPLSSVCQLIYVHVMSAAYVGMLTASVFAILFRCPRAVSIS